MGEQQVTPRPIIDSVIRSVCGRDVEQLQPLSGGGMNETYRVDLQHDLRVVLRIARQPTPWFIDESHLMTRARDAGVPTAEVLGLEHRHHDGELLSFSIQRFLPGRPLDELLPELPPAEQERLVVDSGELLAQVHGVAADRGLRHELRTPDPEALARALQTVGRQLGPTATSTIGRGAEFLGELVIDLAPPTVTLAQGDFMPKNLLVDQQAIVGVIDWEFAGPASPAFDLARWEVSAGPLVHDRSDLLRRGYARVADPDQAAGGLVPAFAIDWALEMLGWRYPAGPAQLQRGVDIIARYTAD